MCLYQRLQSDTSAEADKHEYDFRSPLICHISFRTMWLGVALTGEKHMAAGGGGMAKN
jgi:hypothetical protein